MLFAVLFAALSAVASPPDQVEALLRAGQTALAARDYETAVREFQAVLSVDPRNAPAHINLGIIALIRGNAARGLTHFSAVPDNPRALIGRLDCELRLGKREDARSTAKRLESMTAGDPRASEHVGKLLAGADEYVAAIPFLRRVDGATAANLLGVAEERVGDTRAAIEAFRKGARLDPGNLEYRIDYAAVLLNSGAIVDAVAEFRSADEQFPRSVRVKLGLGSALYLAEHHEAAAQVLLEAVRLEPQSRSFDLLGRVYEAAGPLQPEIRVEFEKYLKTNPSDAVAYAHLAAIAHSSRIRARSCSERPETGIGTAAGSCSGTLAAWHHCAG